MSFLRVQRATRSRLSRLQQLTISLSALQWFSAIDSDRSGQLDPAELQKALAQGNLHFSQIACSRIIRWVEQLWSNF
jgi:hypothetical protein